MHREILTTGQEKLLPLVGKFKNHFGLVGGTAIALQIGHRRSIDFDLFSLRNFKNYQIRKAITAAGKSIGKVYKDEKGQFTFFVNEVRFTFFYYPFPIEFLESFEKFFRMPNLLTLAAMKAYALGRRAKWKDYVDLYFIINSFHSVDEISSRAQQIFAAEFNARIFREQLGYFTDINYTEEVEFLPGYKVSDATIKKALAKFSVS